MSMKGKETMSNEKIVVGKFGATYGIRGWLKVFSYTDNAENLPSLSFIIMSGSDVHV